MKSAGGSARSCKHPTELTVGCRDARKGKHAKDYHQQKQARSACTGIGGAATSLECAVRDKQPMSTSDASEQPEWEKTNQIVVVLDLDLSVMLVNRRKGVVVLLAARRSRDNR